MTGADIRLACMVDKTSAMITTTNKAMVENTDSTLVIIAIFSTRLRMVKTSRSAISASSLAISADNGSTRVLMVCHATLLRGDLLDAMILSDRRSNASSCSAIWTGNSETEPVTDPVDSQAANLRTRLICCK